MDDGNKRNFDFDSICAFCSSVIEPKLYFVINGLFGISAFVTNTLFIWFFNTVAIDGFTFFLSAVHKYPMKAMSYSHSSYLVL